MLAKNHLNLVNLIVDLVVIIHRVLCPIIGLKGCIDSCLDMAESSLELAVPRTYLDQ
jgi:hypothetical protein